MNDEDWDRMEDWFHRLAPLDDAARTRLLGEIHSDDPGFGEQVLALLAAHDAESPLDRLAAKLAGRTGDE